MLCRLWLLALPLLPQVLLDIHILLELLKNLTNLFAATAGRLWAGWSVECLSDFLKVQADSALLEFVLVEFLVVAVVVAGSSAVEVVCTGQYSRLSK